MDTNRFRFTKAALDALPNPKPGKRVVYHDTKTTGLQVRVTHVGIKTFCVYRRIKGGQPQRITLGRFPEMTIEQAKRKAAEINAAIEGGANPAQAKRAHKEELTLAEFFGHFIENKRNRRNQLLSPATKAGYEDQFSRYLTPVAQKKLSKIHKEEVARLIEKIGRAYPTTANRVRALVSSIYGLAIKRGLITDNPAKNISSYAENSRDRFLQSDELPRFFQSLAEEANTTMRDYFLLSLLTGARRGNVLSMRWRDISLERAEWRIAMTKNGTPQTVTLSAEAMEILLARKETAQDGAEYVLPGTGKAGHLIEPKNGWKRVLERAGLSDLRIHDLRRTLGSWQAKQGASLAIIGKSLNHKSIQTTAIYARLDLDPVRQSVNAATAAMMEAAGVKNTANVLPLRARK